MNRLFQPRALTESEQVSWNVRLEAAAALLSATWQSTVSLHPTRVFDTAFGPIKHIVRCRVESSDPPQSVIIKDIRRRDGTQFDPDTRDRINPAYRFFNDCACTQFLSIGLAVQSCPNLIAVDSQKGFCLLEDLGNDMSLLTALSGQSQQLAANELIRFAGALAEIHGRSVGQEGIYRQIRQTFGPGYSRVSTQDREYIEQKLPAIWANCTALGLNGSLAQQEIQQVLAVLSEPGEFLCLIHRDAIPPNFISTGDRLCIFDFEFGGYGHALVDLAQLRMSFPTYGQPAQIPHTVVERVEQAYIEQFTHCSGQQISQSTFARALTEITCFWVISELASSMSPALDASHTESERLGVRLLTRIDAFCRLSDQTGHLNQIAAFFGGISNEILLRQGVNQPLTMFPAFTQ